MPPKKTDGAAKTPRKAATAKGYKRAAAIPKDFTVEDTATKTKWRVGELVGQGGFADVYTAFEAASKATNAKHVIKIEPKDNGPLFQEIKFFKAAAKKQSIGSFIVKHNMKSLGMMEYIASGVVEDDTSIRWLVLPRLGRSVQEILDEHSGKFSHETVLKLALQLIDILEYIHSQGYAHADIKAGNLMTGVGKSNQIYLIDFGLVKKFLVDGKHIDYFENPKAAHDGTLELTSLDAHKGAAPSRRGDMQILGFNLVKWLTGSLPWSNTTDVYRVRAEKNGYLQDPSEFLRVAFADYPNGVPKDIKEYFQTIKSLSYSDSPDYEKLRGHFQKASKDAKYRKSELFAAAETSEPAPAVKRIRSTRSVDKVIPLEATEPAAKRTRKAGSEAKDLTTASSTSVASSSNKLDLMAGMSEQEMADMLKQLPPGQRFKLRKQLEKVDEAEDDAEIVTKKPSSKAKKAQPTKKDSKTEGTKVKRRPAGEVSDNSDGDVSSDEESQPSKKVPKKASFGAVEVDLSKLPPGQRRKVIAEMKKKEADHPTEAAADSNPGPSTSNGGGRPKRGAAVNYAEENIDNAKKTSRRRKGGDDDE